MNAIRYVPEVKELSSEKHSSCKATEDRSKQIPAK